MARAARRGDLEKSDLAAHKQAALGHATTEELRELAETAKRALLAQCSLADITAELERRKPKA